MATLTMSQILEALGGLAQPQSVQGVSQYLDKFGQVLRDKLSKEPDDVYTKTQLDFIEGMRAATPQNVPQPPSLTRTYLQLRDTYGLGQIENQLNQLRQQLQELDFLSQKRMTREARQPVAAGVIEGRLGQIQQQTQLQKQQLTNQIQTLSDVLKTAYSVVENIVNLTNMDWNNAYKLYSDEFQRAFQIYSAARDDAFRKESMEKSIAKANLQTLINLKTKGLIDWNTLSPEQKVQINKIEKMLGLPSGFVKNIQIEPNARVLFMSERIAPGGIKVLDVAYRMPDGSIKHVPVNLGRVFIQGSGGSGGGGGVSSLASMFKDNPNALIETVFASAIGTIRRKAASGKLTERDLKYAYKIFKDGLAKMGANVPDPAGLFWELFSRTTYSQAISGPVELDGKRFGVSEQARATTRRTNWRPLLYGAGLAGATVVSSSPAGREAVRGASILTRLFSGLRRRLRGTIGSGGRGW